MLYEDYASTSMNYSKGYATYISPDDFLSLTTMHPERIESESRDLNIKGDVVGADDGDAQPADDPGKGG